MSIKSIWIIADDRPGNYSGAIGLAQSLSLQLGFEVKIKKITYNSLAKIPNFLKFSPFCTIDQFSRNNLLKNLETNKEEKPEIIISAGRKAAPIAAELKAKYQAFTIQIMNPDINFNKFDLVILPDHDRDFKAKNIIRSIGALNKINEESLKEEERKFSSLLQNIAAPKIALLIGGSSKKNNFNQEIATRLANIVSKITNNMNGHLIALNSRRTGKEITEIIDQNLKCSKTFFKWQNSNQWQNPYLAILQNADFIITTGDSISMCSESCFVKKPIYIFNPQEICSKKHLKFHQYLFTHNFAKKLDDNIIKLENYPAKKLDETSRIAKEISRIYQSQKNSF